MSSSTRLILRPEDAFDLLRHWRWMSVIHGCPMSVIRPSLLLLPALGTVCPNMSRPHLYHLAMSVFRGRLFRRSSSGLSPQKMAAFVVKNRSRFVRRDRSSPMKKNAFVRFVTARRTLLRHYILVPMIGHLELAIGTLKPISMYEPQ